MKELSVEEKARAYDNALERARQIHKEGKAQCFDVMVKVFPELAESEDEKIRKELIEFVKSRGGFKQEYIAWLEKQAEQKPADKVEPKFKVGDWVMLDRPVLITKVEDMPYNTHQYWTSDGTWFGDATKAKLWTIQDAKDGDVLNSVRVKATIIFKEWNSDGKHVNAYCALQKGILIKQEMLWDRDFEPATKEQRDTLMKAMADAGYIFDFEKELKKIEQKPVEWSEEDEKMISSIILLLASFMGNEDKIDWLKFLKDRVGCEGHCTTKQEWSKEIQEEFERKYNEGKAAGIELGKEEIRKQLSVEWSEEDLHNIERCITKIEIDKANWEKNGKAKTIVDADNELIDWLKSLRPQKQWKPSDEQITWLYRAADMSNIDSRMKQVLNKLYEPLKKLREE